MLVNRVVHQTSQIYGDTWATSLQSLAPSFFHSCLELHLPDNLFASPTKSATDRRSIFSAASAEADDNHSITTSSTNTTTQLLPATSTTLNMASLNSCYFQMPRHLSCIEGEKQDWSMATNFLPKDMLVEILARLPVKSLLRFRSVAKSWRDMVKEPSFITKHHLTQVVLNYGNCVLTRATVPMKHGTEFEFALLTEDEQEISFTFLELPFSLEASFWDMLERGEAVYEVAGPCNGIVVISNGDDQLFLWNPATREYKAFPPASLSPSWSDKLYRGCSNVGFGIDPITKDYKVVRIWNFCADGEDFSIGKAEVLSLSANNSSCMWPKGGGESWKIIDDVSPACLYECSNGGAYFNGKYYWYIETFFEGKCRIVWFDMGAEVFGLVELPDLLYLRSPITSRLTTTMFKEGELCLAMVRLAYKIEEEKKHMYQIWIIVDDDEGFSWTNYATVGPFSKMEAPLGVFGKNEELVVFDTCFNEQEGTGLESYVYNIRTRVKKKIMQGLYFDLYLPLAIYNESLVSVL